MFNKDEEVFDWCGAINFREGEVLGEVSGWGKNNRSSNQPTIVIVENIPEGKGPEVFTNSEIPEEQVTLEQGYYRCVYVMTSFNKDVGIESKEEQAYMEDDPDKEEMEYAKLDDEREHQWRMVFEENYGGVDDWRELLHAQRWDVYVNEKEKLIKGEYSVEIDISDRKKVIWEVVDNHVVEEENDHDEIGLWGFN